MGRGGKEGFSINVAERRSGGRTCPKPETALSLWVWVRMKTQTITGTFSPSFQLAGSFPHLVWI